MSVSLKYLQDCSAQTGYRVEPLEKVVRLGEMAADVARHPFLGSVLALKGGGVHVLKRSAGFQTRLSGNRLHRTDGVGWPELSSQVAFSEI
jgi:hypothetical protein